MIVGIYNDPRDYAWGSRTALAELLDRVPSGRPEAEYWLGTHAGSPAHLCTPNSQGATELSDLTTLPFLLKVLAADAPLSLQAHPNLAQARAGFARENALGIPLDAANRNYRDAKYKPEMIFSLSNPFTALCGFRPVADTRRLLDRLGDDPTIETFRRRLIADSSLPAVFEWLISRAHGVDELVARVVASTRESLVPEFRMVGELAKSYPGDPGVVIALLLNRVELARGEALYLPAGNIHAYLRGVGVELMAASDNVLRGGLTSKHVDVQELLDVLDFRPIRVAPMRADESATGLRVFRPDVPDFELVVVEPVEAAVHLSLHYDCVILCTSASVLVRGASMEVSLSRGDSIYVTADESDLTFIGNGCVFLATTNSESNETLPNEPSP